MPISRLLISRWMRARAATFAALLAAAFAGSLVAVPGSWSASAATADTLDAASAAAHSRALRANHRARVRQAVRQRSAGTYLGRVIIERDSSLERWTDRTANPIRVWIAAGDSSDGWRPAFADTVSRALDEWQEAGIPIRFTLVADSAEAEVRVHWTRHLAKHASGLTVWHSDAQRWVRNADVTIALRASDGSRQDGRGIRAIALHEIGHVVGLGHSSAPGDVMHPWVNADSLSPSDRATAHVLYAFPPGRVY